MSNNTTLAAPIAWTPSAYWDGNDGLWNTFTIGVGTPPQNFRILPSTAGQETWLPNPQGCTTADPSNSGYCGYLRGSLPYNGVNSSGFANNDSSSWSLIGLYTLDAQEADLGYTGNGLYGFDTVALNGTSEAMDLSRQVVASVPDLDYWLGYFGLGPKPINFTTFNAPLPNYMSTLISSNRLPSLSWGYTAGAYYRDKASASLTLGGYDMNRFQPSNLTFLMNADNSRPLQVAVQKVIAENTLGGTGVNLWPTATYHFIDSTLPHIWLPNEACDAFVQNFGLTYDNTTDLFLINDTMRQRWLAAKPTVTFVLGNSTTAGTGFPTQNIVLPYAAFDLQASYPFYQQATNYFPIRRAANTSQHTIGRVFLQEAYLIADHERNNFTLAQTSFDNLDSQYLVAIQKPSINGTSGTSPTQDKKSSSLGGGAIGGIVVGAIVALALIVLGIWFVIRRNKKIKHEPVPTSDPERPDDFSADRKTITQVRGSELPSENALVEAPAGGSGRHASELPSPPPAFEAEGDMGKMRSRPGMYEMAGSQGDSGVFEAQGSEGVRHELYGSGPYEHVGRPS
ncbi:hypothetical protein LTR62_005692 [Meristemomyces frigidus]|uniref:Peptidase A1 domain-containing protein n=1 Tax=Meristemomyces frigidus TaxID=1508187 RepID=A0AAN7TCW7_9PEZI|nr:hypothetical protein LTR62_005692 [Meristemomyces frigidus]